MYQLVSASGRESATNAQQSSRAPVVTVPLPSANSAYTNYTRIYRYDAGGNLTKIQHSAPMTDNNYTTYITVSNDNNRAVPGSLTTTPAVVDGYFTARGEQKTLLPGQTLTWTSRGELNRVTPVTRDGAGNDEEWYRYNALSQRVLKVSKRTLKLSPVKSNNSIHTYSVLYLPDMEARSLFYGNTEKESLQIINVNETVRALQWLRGKPEGIDDKQLRYSYGNLTGSGTLEVDGEGYLISQEEYYPYGGTAVWTARSRIEADYKTVRYSGKERDTTGLYYYGYRYYQPWTCRWLSADPAGTADGLNVYRMVRNNPVTLADDQGMAPKKVGSVYAPFVAPDLLEQSVGVNLVRHLKGKPLYPIIVSDDNALKRMEQFKTDEISKLQAKVEKFSDAMQSLEISLKSNPGWTADSLREQLGPELFDKSMQDIATVSQELSLLKRLSFISNSSSQVLKRLSPENDKLYIIGHGGAGMDLLAADQHMELGMITATQLAKDLAAGGLNKLFQDIRVMACYSADTVSPTSFDMMELDRSARPIPGLLGLRWGRKIPFAQSLHDALVSRGFSAITVSGYHGAGVTYSRQEYHLRRLAGQADIRSSTVRRAF